MVQCIARAFAWSVGTWALLRMMYLLKWGVTSSQGRISKCSLLLDPLWESRKGNGIKMPFPWEPMHIHFTVSLVLSLPLSLFVQVKQLYWKALAAHNLHLVVENILFYLGDNLAINQSVQLYFIASVLSYFKSYFEITKNGSVDIILCHLLMFPGQFQMVI